MKEGDAAGQHVQTARWQDKGRETEMSLTAAVHGSVRLGLAQTVGIMMKWDLNNSPLALNADSADSYIWLVCYQW